MWLANKVRAALAGSKIKLWKEITQPLGVSTVKSHFTECDYDGYEEVTITNFLAVHLDPDTGGASISSGTQQWDYGPASSPAVGNTVKGYYLESATGDLVLAGEFESLISMGLIGQSILVDVVLNYGS